MIFIRLKRVDKQRASVFLKKCIIILYTIQRTKIFHQHSDSRVTMHYTSLLIFSTNAASYNIYCCSPLKGLIAFYTQRYLQRRLSFQPITTRERNLKATCPGSEQIISRYTSSLTTLVVTETNNVRRSVRDSGIERPHR